MTRMRWRGAAALMAALVLVLGACTTGDDDDADAGGDTTTTTAAAEEPAGELGTGVTDDTIKIAYTFVDTEALQARGINVRHGPYGDIMTALVDDLNANGGINGRTIELVTLPYNPSGGNAESLAACARATEDEQVFAVLGALQGEANLCIVEQHATILVGGNQTPAFLARARAPWATWTASSATSNQALVQALDEQDKLEGRTIAVYGLEADQESVDVAVAALEDAGVEVAFEAINDGDPADRAAIDAQDATLGQRMNDEGVDAVVIAGRNVPGQVWSQNGFLPRLWVAESGILSVFAGQGGLTGFPEVLAVGAAPIEVQFESAPYQQCAQIYEEASGETVPSPAEAEHPDDPLVALADACNALTVFRDAAEAAGETLNQETFLEGVESLTEVDLVGAPGSFGPDQYAGQVEFWVFEPNPDYGGFGSGTPAILPVSDESFIVE